MNITAFSEHTTETDEIAILNEIWDKQIVNLEKLQNNIATAIVQAEQIAKQFETHHKGMRYTISQLEAVITDLSELKDDYKEKRELLDFIIQNPRPIIL